MHPWCKILLHCIQCIVCYGFSNAITLHLTRTRDLDEFHRFVDAITTPFGVGRDGAEDVFGGLDAVLKLNWPKVGTKVQNHKRE